MVKSHRLGTETAGNRIKRSGDDILDVNAAAKTWKYKTTKRRIGFAEAPARLVEFGNERSNEQTFATVA